MLLECGLGGHYLRMVTPAVRESSIGSSFASCLSKPDHMMSCVGSDIDDTAGKGLLTYYSAASFMFRKASVTPATYATKKTVRE